MIRLQINKKFICLLLLGLSLWILFFCFIFIVKQFFIKPNPLVLAGDQTDPRGTLSTKIENTIESTRPYIFIGNKITWDTENFSVVGIDSIIIEDFTHIRRYLYEYYFNVNDSLLGIFIYKPGGVAIEPKY